jgi:hypothetical protein
MNSSLHAGQCDLRPCVIKVKLEFLSTLPKALHIAVGDQYMPDVRTKPNNHDILLVEWH